MSDRAMIIDQAVDLRQIVSRAKHEPENVRPRLVTVVSGKGGVGKSTIALNLSVKLSDLGKRVMLVDGDSNIGNLDIMLGISPRPRIDEVLRGSSSVADILVGVMPGLSLLPGTSGDGKTPVFEEKSHRRLIGEIVAAGTGFDVIMIDTAAGLTAEMVAYAVSSDEVVIVMTPEMTAIVDAYAAIKIIAGSHPAVSASVIVNNVRSVHDAEEAFTKLQSAVTRFLNIDLRYCGAVPSDSFVHKAVAEQEPVVRRYPESAAAHSFDRLAQQLAVTVPIALERKAAEHE